MLKNYIKIAWRNLKRNRAYALINTIGLSVGVASCLLIFLFIQDELSYDKFHEKAERIYRIYQHFEIKSDLINQLRINNTSLGPALMEELPEVSNTVRFSNRWAEVLVESENEKFYENDFFFTDPSVFDVFSFKLIRGTTETALNRPFTVVLTEEMARKYFGESNPLGKTLTIKGLWDAREFEVTGIMENVPENAHFNINFLTSLETYAAAQPTPSNAMIVVGSPAVYTYVLLKEGIKPADIQPKVHSFLSKYRSKARAKSFSYRFQALTDIHLYSNFQQEIEPNSDVRYLYIFGSIALLILVIAGINYMNLATARSADRAVEVGIRKTLGVNRPGLISQFLCESLLFCLISFVLALFLVEPLLPYFNEWTGKEMELQLSNPFFFLSLMGVLILIGLLAGMYPAFVLSRFNPNQVFSGMTGGRKKSLLRNTLVVFQFAITVSLIMGTLVITGQLDYIQNKRLGLNKEHVVSISTGVEFNKIYHALKDELLRHTNISSVTHLNTMLPFPDGLPAMSMKPEGLNSRNVLNVSVGEDFIQTLDIPLLKGHGLSGFSATEGDYMPVMINQTAVNEWGWEDPLGKTIDMFRTPFRVVGVVGDFHYRSLKEPVTPLVIWHNNYARNVLVRIKPDNIRQSISYIRNVWNEMGPGTPLVYTFLDDQFDSLYKAEDRLASVFGGFTLLAVFIACLGLFGLVAYTTERRTKEIGIRKVLGATVSNIVNLLSKDFLKLVAAGFIIAVPIAWYAMNRWLQDFAYRIEIGPSIFLLAGGVAIAIALLTVSWQSMRAALANPVESLRNE